MDDDNEFFNVTCHISANLRSKIAKGEFVDLEQLLLCDKNGSGLTTASDESRVELVTAGGQMFFRPVKKFTNLRVTQMGTSF